MRSRLRLASNDDCRFWTSADVSVEDNGDSGRMACQRDYQLLSAHTAW